MVVILAFDCVSLRAWDGAATVRVGRCPFGHANAGQQRRPADEQDQNYYPLGTMKACERNKPRPKKKKRDKRTNAEKFKAGLAAAIGEKAAEAYIGRKQRREGSK